MDLILTEKQKDYKKSLLKGIEIFLKQKNKTKASKW